MGRMFPPALVGSRCSGLIHSSPPQLCKAAARSSFAPRGVIALILETSHTFEVHVYSSSLQVPVNPNPECAKRMRSLSCGAAAGARM